MLSARGVFGLMFCFVFDSARLRRRHSERQALSAALPSLLLVISKDPRRNFGQRPKIARFETGTSRDKYGFELTEFALCCPPFTPPERLWATRATDYYFF